MALGKLYPVEKTRICSFLALRTIDGATSWCFCQEGFI
jgi:hypothetical protein